MYTFVSIHSFTYQATSIMPLMDYSKNYKYIINRHNNLCVLIFKPFIENTIYSHRFSLVNSVFIYLIMNLTVVVTQQANQSMGQYCHLMVNKRILYSTSDKIKNLIVDTKY